MRGVAERVLTHPLLRQPLEIDFRAHHLRLILEALGLGDDIAVLGDQRVPVPREVGGRFADARRRVRVRREASRGLARDQRAAVVGLANRDVRRRQIQQHGRAGERRVRRRRNRHPQVLANLGVEGEQRLLLVLENEIVAERHRATAGEIDFVARGSVGRGELPRLVKFAVVREIGLRHDAENLPAMNHDRAVKQMMSIWSGAPTTLTIESLAVASTTAAIASRHASSSARC